LLCHGTVCVVGKIRDLILQLSKSSIYSTKPCDGCAEPIAGVINYISPEAEFTPPVIYSTKRREKLIFMAEAIPALQQAGRGFVE
ncbi:hypothetical protein PU700_26755, partial [Klebsiella pneumoniae]